MLSSADRKGQGISFRWAKIEDWALLTQVEQIERCVEQYQRRGAAAGDVYEVAELRLGVVANRAEDCDDGPRPTEVKQIPFKQIRLSLWVRN